MVPALALALALAAGDQLFLSIGKDGVPVVTDFPRGDAVEYEPGDFERIALGQKNVAHRGLGDPAARRAARARPGPVDPGALAEGVAAAPAELDGLLDDASRRHAVPLSLLTAVVAVESAFKADAVSSAGAQGLMQLMPATAADLGVKDPFDPAQNIEGGARYLGFLLRHFGSDELALAAYNAGPGRVARAGGVPDFPETRAYIDSVLGLAASYEAASASR